MNTNKFNIINNIKISLSLEFSYLTKNYYLSVLLFILNHIFINFTIFFMSAPRTYLVISLLSLIGFYIYVFYQNNNNFKNKYNISIDFTLFYFFILILLSISIYFTTFAFILSFLFSFLLILGKFNIDALNSMLSDDIFLYIFIGCTISSIILYFITNSIILFINNRMSNLASSFLINDNSL